MVNLLVDTCVWLDIAKDPRQAATLNFLTHLCKIEEVRLIVPATVEAEFNRNRPRVIQETRQSLSTTLKRAKEVIYTYGEKRKRRHALDQLNDQDHRLPVLGEAVAGTLKQIESLIKQFELVEATDAITLQAAKRAINGQAPCHRGTNSINDATLIETYAHALNANGAAGQRFMFVTHNKKDFSQKDGDQRQPHADIAPFFSKIKSRYFISLVEALRRIRPDIRAELMDYDNWTSETRKFTEISDAIGVLIDKVWYNRHKYHEQQIEDGEVKLVEKYTPGRNQVETVASVWEQAKVSAKKLERKYGRDELGPYSDFEWGMVNGKLSALRWVFGEDWDELYT